MARRYLSKVKNMTNITKKKFAFLVHPRRTKDFSHLLGKFVGIGEDRGMNKHNAKKEGIGYDKDFEIHSSHDYCLEHRCGDELDQALSSQFRTLP